MNHISIILRICYALRLTWISQKWIWSRLFSQEKSSWQFSMTFDACSHCDERLAVPGLIFCQQCIGSMAEDYEQEIGGEAVVGSE